MDDHISFSAKKGSWIAVKKMAVDENTGDDDVARILLSIRDTVSPKIYQYLGEDFNVGELEKMAEEAVPSGRLNEEKIIAAIKSTKSPKTTKRLKEFTDDKKKLEIFKGLYAELVMARLKLPGLNLKALDKYLDEKYRRLE